MSNESSFSPYHTYDRIEWSRLGRGIPLSVSEGELERLRGKNDPIVLAEVSEVYLPLAKLIYLLEDRNHIDQKTTHLFLGKIPPKVPFIIGIAGSVAAGKSTAARLLKILLSRLPHRPQVDLVTTDGFLHPNAVLEKRGLMKRKGFPESYDVRRLIRFLADIKSGVPQVEIPVYSHLIYDIVPGETQVIRQPDLLILEGLNILQTPQADEKAPRLTVSDFLDFSLYVDAREDDLTRWYVERFQLLRKTAFRQPESYFRRYANLSVEEAEKTALSIWKEINARNLAENIAPTRERARLILEKGADHSIRRIRLRRF
ncbi:type I pantothenate kinase [Desmospora profundinema]|uniref:Pantothenate kinase n=1 Tax=Desmospora profundinema TaxID=1571184 RepID=A0ABU1IJY8_9BACL|nr:type I pantothenate kinase [Desmospora profundinema]MDR6225073.1 type I pantothenate kinase [Desmospora profundinema]